MQYHGGDADMSRVIEFSNALNAAEGGIFNINVAAPASGRRYRGSCPEGSRDPRHYPRHCCRCHPGPHLPAGACTLGTIFDYGKNGYYFSDEALAMFESTCLLKRATP